MNLRIREAETSDLARIAELWVQLTDYHNHLDARHWQRAPDGPMHFRAWIEEGLADPQRVLLVAEAAGTVIGFGHGMLKRSPPPMKPRVDGFVTDLVVDTTLRRRGVGSRLLDALEAWFAEHGADCVTLAVAAKSVSGLDFYRVHGFEPRTWTLWKPLKANAPADAQGTA